MELLIFGVFAVLALAGAVGVILAKNPVHCSIALLVTLFSIAALFAVLAAEFLAVVQLLVYAGGIMVLFLFVIMLVDLETRGLDAEAGRVGPRVSTLQRWIAAFVSVGFAGAIAGLVTPAVVKLPAVSTPQAQAALRTASGGAMGNVQAVGNLLYTSYLLPFELASVLLLVAMIGATIVARREA